MDIYSNQSIAKYIFILASAKGKLNKDYLRDRGLHISTWDNRYLKPLLNSGLITEKSKKYNEKEYFFQHDLLIERLKKLIEEDIKANQARTKAFITDLESERARLKDVGRGLKNPDLVRRNRTEAASIPSLIKELEKFNKEFDMSFFQSSFWESVHNYSWLLAKLVKYFEHLARMNKAISVNDALREFLLVISYGKKEALDYHPSSFLFRYDSTKVDYDCIVKIAFNYARLTSMKPEWMLLLRPYLKELEDAFEEEKMLYDEEMGKKRDEEFHQELKRAKTLEEKYWLYRETYSKQMADEFLEDELDKEFGKHTRTVLKDEKQKEVGKKSL